MTEKYVEFIKPRPGALRLDDGTIKDTFLNWLGADGVTYTPTHSMFETLGFHFEVYMRTLGYQPVVGYIDYPEYDNERVECIAYRYSDFWDEYHEFLFKFDDEMKEELKLTCQQLFFKDLIEDE